MTLHATSSDNFHQHGQFHLVDPSTGTYKPKLHDTCPPQSYLFEPSSIRPIRGEVADDPMYLSLRIHIATLEKDLEHCRREKAEAEITVQHLAHLNAVKSASGPDHGSSEEVSLLRKQLGEANSEVENLKTSLGEHPLLY